MRRSRVLIGGVLAVVGLVTAVRTRPNGLVQAQPSGRELQSGDSARSPAGTGGAADQRPYIGLRINEGYLTRFDDGVRGVAVEVVTGGAAHAAGVRTGDVVVAADGSQTDSLDALVRAIAAHRPLEMMELQVVRVAAITHAARPTTSILVIVDARPSSAQR